MHYNFSCVLHVVVKNYMQMQKMQTLYNALFIKASSKVLSVFKTFLQVFYILFLMTAINEGYNT